MKTIFGLGKISTQKLIKPVVTLGVFDGLHRGHVRLIKETSAVARRVGGISVVVTFHPHPQDQACIYPLYERIRLFQDLGIDLCFVVEFTRSFAKMSAREFIGTFLVKKIRPYYVVVGDNFRFGRFAKGSPRLLKKLAKIYNFRLKVVRVIKLKNKTISSTYIRYLIKTSRLQKAKALLTRPVSVFGRVIKGDSLGRSLGFPTANIKPSHDILASAGIYIAKVVLNNKNLKGLCYIGSKPTFVKRKIKLPYVEIYIFDFTGNIYGENLEVQLIKKIRQDQKFNSKDALVRQINKDVMLARDYFSHQ